MRVYNITSDIDTRQESLAFVCRVIIKHSFNVLSKDRGDESLTNEKYCGQTFAIDNAQLRTNKVIDTTLNNARRCKTHNAIDICIFSFFRPIKAFFLSIFFREDSLEKI